MHFVARTYVISWRKIVLPPQMFCFSKHSRNLIYLQPPGQAQTTVVKCDKMVVYIYMTFHASNMMFLYGPRWHNRLARRTYSQYTFRFRPLWRYRSCGGCEFEPHPGHYFSLYKIKNMYSNKTSISAIYLCTYMFYVYICVRYTDGNGNT